MLTQNKFIIWGISLIVINACDKHLLIPNRGNLSVSVAVMSGEPEDVERVIRNGGDVNEKDEYGVYPIIRSAQMGDSVMMALLLENGADPDVFGDDGSSALEHAIAKSDYPMIEILLKNGANIKLKNERGESAYDLAVEIGDARTIKLLENIEAGEMK